MTTLEIKQYLDSHPDASLKEYVEHLQNEADLKLKELEKYEAERREWYKNLASKYYKVRHNSVCFDYFYVCEVHCDNRTPIIVADKCYSIMSSNNTLKLIIGSSKENINHLWFGNPTEYGAISIITEISQQEFEDSVTKIKNYIKEFEI